MGEIIGMINEKGGVGKTSGVIAIGEILGLAGYKVLLIDLDPQRNVTSVYRKETDKEKYPSDEQYIKLFCDTMDKKEVENLILKSDYENVSLIPGTVFLKELLYVIHEKNNAGRGSIRPKFQCNISFLKDKFDYIIIDNSPFDSETSRCALCACDSVLTPTNVDNFAFEGIIALINTIKSINDEYGRNINFKGIYFNRSMQQTNLYRDLKDEYGDYFTNVYIPFAIRQSNIMNECNTAFIPLVSYAPKSSLVTDYIHLLRTIDLLDMEHYRTLSTKLKGGIK